MGHFLQIVGQIRGADEVIKEATASGWSDGLVAVVVVSMLLAFGALIKIILDQNFKREERNANEKAELERALISLTEKVTEATTSARDSHNKTTECLLRFSNIMEGVNGDIRELCELLRKTTVCPYRKNATVSQETDQA